MITKQDMFQEMVSSARLQTSLRNPWFVINFSEMGFTGKMFENSELSIFAQFLVVFFNEKRCDWLVDSLLDTRQ